MKKVVLSAFAFVMFSAVAANAQTAPQTQTPATTQTGAGEQGAATQTSPAAPATTEEAKTAVTIEELPAAVKTTLASPTLKVWTATEAFLVKGADGKEYYAINLKKDNESGSVKLDKEGKPVK
jgi:opacity protein-like surface antigen